MKWILVLTSFLIITFFSANISAKPKPEIDEICGDVFVEYLKEKDLPPNTISFICRTARDYQKRENLDRYDAIRNASRAARTLDKRVTLSIIEEGISLVKETEKKQPSSVKNNEVIKKPNILIKDNERKQNSSAKNDIGIKDGGWKTLRWGMTFVEVKKAMPTLEYSGGCIEENDNLQIDINKEISVKSISIKNLIRLETTNNGEPYGLTLFFQNKLFGRIIDYINIEEMMNSDEEMFEYTMMGFSNRRIGEIIEERMEKKRNDILELLKEEYPEGKTQWITESILDIPNYFENKDIQMKNVEIRGFRYETDNNIIFTNFHSLFFYDPEVIEKLTLISIQQEREKSNQDNRNLKKKLF
jgi:hypothetical protein